MKYRLGKKSKRDGEGELKEFLKKRLFVISHIADKLDITNQGLHKILDGKSKKPNRQTLEHLAELTGTRLGFDEDGLYFEPIIKNGMDIDENEKPLKVSEQITEYKNPNRREKLDKNIESEILSTLSKLTDEELKEYLKLVFYMDQESKELIVSLIRKLSKTKEVKKNE